MTTPPTSSDRKTRGKRTVKCAACDRVLGREDYSTNQWGKPSARCKACIPQPAPAPPHPRRPEKHVEVVSEEEQARRDEEARRRYAELEAKLQADVDAEKRRVAEEITELERVYWHEIALLQKIRTTQIAALKSWTTYPTPECLSAVQLKWLRLKHIQISAIPSVDPNCRCQQFNVHFPGGYWGRNLCKYVEHKEIDKWIIHG